MGIDFGLKRIGLAYSESGFALPLAVVQNNEKIIDEIIRLAKDKNVEAFVIGESKKYSGEENPIMEEIRNFSKILEAKSGFKVYFEPEFMTSAHAEKTQGKHDMLDASAASLILQSFIDKRKNSGLNENV